jgi:hypothetical protein
LGRMVGQVSEIPSTPRATPSRPDAFPPVSSTMFANSTITAMANRMNAIGRLRMGRGKRTDGDFSVCDAGA